MYARDAEAEWIAWVKQGTDQECRRLLVSSFPDVPRHLTDSLYQVIGERLVDPIWLEELRELRSIARIVGSPEVTSEVVRQRLAQRYTEMFSTVTAAFLRSLSTAEAVKHDNA